MNQPNIGEQKDKSANWELDLTDPVLFVYLNRVTVGLVDALAGDDQLELRGEDLTRTHLVERTRLVDPVRHRDGPQQKKTLLKLFKFKTQINIQKLSV